MPRLKNKPIVLDEGRFIDWLLEIYYYRFMDRGVAVAQTPLLAQSVKPELKQTFIAQLRAQLVHFDLTFPLTKLPALYEQALREISVHPSRKKANDESATPALPGASVPPTPRAPNVP